MGRRPNTIQGTAAVRRDAPPDAHLAAYEAANRRLHHSATVMGVATGEPTMETLPINGSGNGMLLLVLSAPILTTGTGPSHDTPATVDEAPGRRQAGA